MDVEKLSWIPLSAAEVELTVCELEEGIYVNAGFVRKHPLQFTTESRVIPLLRLVSLAPSTLMPTAIGLPGTYSSSVFTFNELI